MCLATPGKVIKLERQNGLLMGALDFGGIIKTVCLEYVPDIRIGQYAMVHAGFAINLVDEDEVREFYQLWQQVLDAQPVTKPGKREPA
jgi:hydrogenase expression/formation protein HypC